MDGKKNIISDYRKAVETTAIYQAGRILANARHSLKHALLAPVRLLQLARRHRELERTNFKNIKLAPSKAGIHGYNISSYALALLSKHQKNIEALVNEVRKEVESINSYNLVIAEAARISAYSDACFAVKLLNQVENIESQPSLLKRLGFLQYRSGNLTDSAKILGRKVMQDYLSASDKIQTEKIISEAGVFRDGFKIPARCQSDQHSKVKIMYVCHTSFPHHTNGYAVRTHNIAKALRGQGIDIHCVSRPGYPWDRKDAQHSHNVNAEQNIEGIIYYRYQTANVTECPFSEYVERSSETLLRHIQKHKPSLVLAASNYVNALPALIAARKAGLPFVYDIRGLWEFTAASKIENWEYTERFQLFRRMETLVANESDKIITISTALKEELLSRGIQPEKISVALNATYISEEKPENFREDIRRELNISASATVFGFVGSVEKYEGLQVLMHAIDQLIQDGRDVYVVIIGSGLYTSTLHELCCDLGIIKRVRFVGRVSYEKAQTYYAAIDVCVYPRLPDKVCNLVPPLKPLEAMAHNKPVITSSLAPIYELVGAGNAIFVGAGNQSELGSALCRIIDSDELSIGLVSKGSQFCKTQRCWSIVSKKYKDAILELEASD